MPSTPNTNATHDPSLKSWVDSANDPSTDFPIQNLPLCVFIAEDDGDEYETLGVAIGDQVLNISAVAEAGTWDELDSEDDHLLTEALFEPDWNPVAAEPKLWPLLRARLQKFLSAETPAGQQTRRLRSKALTPIADAEFALPMYVGDYTDFYASKHHAANVGSMFRPDNPLLPNYTHVPIGYHGRASSLVVSGTPIRRPLGQQSPPDDNPAQGPSFGPCKMLDYELELGVFVGRGNEQGDPIPMRDVAPQLFGLCLVNDWSARDIQKWEYQPLGPFLAKNFATSLSPFVAMMDALTPFRVPGPERSASDPQPLDYLRSQDNWGLDIQVEAAILTPQMREKNLAPHTISTGSFKHMYWTLAQMLVHHASNGCNLRSGDLLASGTISGPEPHARGCLLEATWDAPGKPRKPISLPTGETRTFLHDGDEVILRAFCQRDGFKRIGFGECRGIIEPARE